MFFLRSRRYATPTLILIAFTLLTGCGSNDTVSENQSSTASPSATSSETAISPFSSSGESPSASSSTSASAEPVTPEGYQTVTASGNGISFAVPADWEVLDAKTYANDESLREKFAYVAEETGNDVDSLLGQLKQVDMMVMSTDPDETGFSANIGVTPSPYTIGTVPTEEELKELLASQSITTENYEVVDTPLGEAATMSYTLQVGSQAIRGTSMVVPTGQPLKYSLITVSAGTAEASAQYTQAVAQSLTVAQ